MQVIDFHTKIPNKRQAAFVIFYAKDGKPWQNYHHDKYGRTELTIPTCLMMNRSDGFIGFVGGGVEEGESLEEAAIREVREEIGQDIHSTLTPLVAHELETFSTHSFTSQVSYQDLRKMQKEAESAEHFGSEVTGVFLPHLFDYAKVPGREGGIKNVLMSALALTVREELVHFLLAEHLFSLDELTLICREAKCDLKRLLR